MNDARTRFVLEAILAAPDTTSGERLRAIEMLRELHRGDHGFVDEEVSALDDSALAGVLDSQLIVDVVRAILEDREVLGIRPDQYPVTAAYLRGEVARRVDLRVRHVP